MKIKECLILSAGKGTRMGEIGKILPKPLWPLFDKTLIELQIFYARSLGCERLYVNIHHQYDLIKKFLKNRPEMSDVVLIHEEELLDIGGAIHNVKNLFSPKELLVINSDQFLFSNELEKFKLESNHIANLLCIKADNTQQYNKVIFDQKLNFCGIEQWHTGLSDYYTYAGVSLISLEKLEYMPGKSAFFESVCNHKKNVNSVFPLKSVQYWDFGTLERYRSSLQLIENLIVKNKLNDPMIRFLVSAKSLDLTQFNSITKSYRCQSNKGYDFSHSGIKFEIKNLDSFDIQYLSIDKTI